jgi:hypothetical protein
MLRCFTSIQRDVKDLRPSASCSPKRCTLRLCSLCLLALFIHLWRADDRLPQTVELSPLPFDRLSPREPRVILIRGLSRIASTASSVPSRSPSKQLFPTVPPAIQTPLSFVRIHPRSRFANGSFDDPTWYGPIAHSDHLGQAAGLEHGRHQQNVRSRKQQVGQRLAAQGGTVQNPGQQNDAQSTR